MELCEYAFSNAVLYQLINMVQNNVYSTCTISNENTNGNKMTLISVVCIDVLLKENKGAKHKKYEDYDAYNT